MTLYPSDPREQAAWQRFEQARARALGRKRFRGGIVENCKRFQFVGSGYKAMPAAQNGYFDIKTARQIAGPMKALLDELVRVVHVIGATQVLKSLIGDAWVIYVLEHIVWPMLVLFEDQDKAELYTRQRFMDTIHNHPELKKFLKEIVDENRHDVTGTRIKGGGAELLVAGLNDGNVSSLAWPLIWISEGWQHKKDGLLEKAFKRADRFPDTCKILNESQASLYGEDLHGQVSKAVPVPLVWRCPACGGEQTWEYQHWNHLRAEDFKPRDRFKISTIVIGGEVAIVSNSPKPGTYAGMKWNPDENLSIEDKAKSAYWECIWCGHHIEDKPPIRKAICDTYTQDYPAAKELCFTLPFESAWDNRFEKTVGNFLIAKASKAEGNDVPLINWYLAERALFYSEKTDRTSVAAITGTYDPNVKQIPNESFRSLQGDCQKDIIESVKQGKEVTGHLWVIVDAVDKAGGTFQLFRGYVHSWDELNAVRINFGVPTRNVAIDGKHWFDTVKEMAAKYRTLEDRRADGSTEPGKKFLATWKIMTGDAARGFKHLEGDSPRIYSPVKNEPVNVLQPNGSWLRVSVPVYRWSNFSVTNQLKMLQRGEPGKPKFIALDASQLACKTAKEIVNTQFGPVDIAPVYARTRAKEVGDFTYENQMNGQMLGEERGKAKWIDLHKQQHYADDSKMGIVLKALKGLIGHIAAADESAQEK